MRAPPTIMGTVFRSPWVRRPWRRRAVVAVLAVVLAILCVFPRAYLARAELMPDDASGGLSSLLGGAGGGALASLGALVGGRQSIESDITIARSVAVASDVMKRLGRSTSRLGKDPARVLAVLRHKVDIEAIRGGILQITVKDHDPVFAQAIVSDYVTAIRSRLAAINVDETAQRKAVAADRLADATANLAQAQSELDRFRRENHLASPEVQLGAAISLVTNLQARLQAELTELEALQKFATPDNIQVQAAQAQIAALRNQIASEQAKANPTSGPSVGAMTPNISVYENLYRNEKFAEAELQIYQRYADTVTVNLLTSSITMSIVEPPYIDGERQLNTNAVAALGLVLLLGALAEFYLAQPSPGASRHAEQ